MIPSPPRVVRFDLETGTIPFPSTLAPIDCPECGTILGIHQPDQDRPDRLLGTCENCQFWYTIEAISDEEMARMIRLPLGSPALTG